MERGQNKESTRDHNRALILRLVRKNGSLLRSDLARITGLTKAAVTKIVQPLLEAGILVEGRYDPADHRKKSLKLAHGGHYFIAVALGLSRKAAAVFDLSGRILERVDRDAGIVPDDITGLRNEVVDLVDDLLAASAVPRVSLRQIGISVPGMVPSSSDDGDRAGPRTPGVRPFDWPSAGLVDALEARYLIPVRMENNSSLAALAEQWFGAGVSEPNFVLYSIGMGVGAGAVLENRWFQGREQVACEIGHTIVDIDGDECYCGNRGCLETRAGFVSAAKTYMRILGREDDFHPADTAPIMNAMLSAAASGDRTAEKQVAEIGDYLGIGAVTLVNIFNPGLLIVVGDFVEDIDIKPFVERISRRVSETAYSSMARTTRVVPSDFGSDTPLLGAYALMLQDFLDSFRRYMPTGSID